MRRPRRYYKQQTIKILFGASGNQCAFPNCMTWIVEPETESSDEMVVGQICHIYAASDNGPRGKPGLTEAERNAPDNLILFCPTHHVIVDGQHETYPAELLIRWKKKHEVAVRAAQFTAIKETQAEILVPASHARSLLDNEINDRTSKLRRARFFAGFDTKTYAKALADAVVDGDLSEGSRSTRTRALAWCARCLAIGDTRENASRILDLAKSTGEGDEVRIAEAFLMASNDQQSAALAMLNRVNSPSSLSAALIIVGNAKGARGALAWLKKSALSFDDFDADGKYMLIRYRLQLKHWSVALELAMAVTSEDSENCPTHYWAAATTRLCKTVTLEARSAVIVVPPFELKSFPMRSDGPSLELRRSAKELYEHAADAAKDLDLPTAANVAHDFALWMMMMDPRDEAAGRKRLSASLRDPSESLRRLNFAFQFGIKFDSGAVEEEIERRLASKGSGDSDVAQARLVLALSQPTPLEAAEYIAKYRGQIDEYLLPEAVALIEIQALAAAGLSDKAERRLAEQSSEEFTGEARTRAERVIAESRGADPITARKEQFARTDALQDLVGLVEAMEQTRDWAGVCQYGATLHARTRTRADAVRLIVALNTVNRHLEVLDFYDENTDVFENVPAAHVAMAWSLYYQGNFLRSKQLLETKLAGADDHDVRALRVALSVASGDWDSLVAFTAHEFDHRDERSALELLRTGHLAQQVGSPYAQRLIRAAAEQGQDDATVLSGAYFLATNAGWEDDATVVEWLGKAAELSGDTGPLQRVSLKDIVDLKPDWERRATEVWGQLINGEVPIFGAARQVNRSVVDLTLFPALANASEDDPRRRAQIFAYSGARSISTPAAPNSIAIDATALYSLALLGMLTDVIRCFDQVVVAHSTLSWLFTEREKASFHQPSQIEGAHELRDLVARDRLQVLRQAPPMDRELETEVGADLATLIGAAQEMSAEHGVQAVVIRPAPVHRLGSLMAESADMAPYSRQLCSCGAVISALRALGAITTEQEQTARAYLTLQEQRWPDEPVVEKGAHLLLDGISVSYLQHLGLLGSLKSAGFTVHLLADEEQEATRLIEYSHRSADVLELIEQVRASLLEGINTGSVKIAPALELSNDELDDIGAHPTFAVMSSVTDVDALVVDDRFINRHVNFEDGGELTPVLTVVDLIDSLVQRGALSVDKRLEYRTSLRRAGYAFVPLTQEELHHYAASAPVVDGAVVETAELKAVRESLLHAQMTTALHLPKEAPWLDATTRVVTRTLKQVWETSGTIADASARASWLLNLSDLRGWAYFTAKVSGASAVQDAYALHVLQLLTPPDRIADEWTGAYLEWIDESILEHIKETSPQQFEMMVSRVRDIIRHRSSQSAADARDEGAGAVEYVRSALALAMTEMFPPSIGRALVNDLTFRKEFGFTAESHISFGADDRNFRRSPLFRAIRSAYGQEPSDNCIVENVTGHKWQVQADTDQFPPTVNLVQDEQRIQIPNFAMLSSDARYRKTVLAFETELVRLPAADLAAWQDGVAAGFQDDDEVLAFYDDLNNTPVRVAEAIRGEIATGKSPVSTLVPDPIDYYTRLVGTYDNEKSIIDFAARVAGDHISELMNWRTHDGLLQGLLSSSHNTICDAISLEAIESSSLIDVFDWLAEKGDLYSILGGIEIGLRVLGDRPELQASLKRLVDHLVGTLLDKECQRFRLLCALIFLVDGELARKRRMAEYPPFYRRLSAIAQASLIERCIIAGNVDVERFCEWAINQRGKAFLLQSLVDCRQEPRWQPQFASAEQLKNEFVGRLFISADHNRDAVESLGIGDLFSDGENSLSVHFERWMTMLPGPLEGAVYGENMLPSDARDEIEAALRAETVTPMSFIPLVSIGLYFKMDDQWPEEAIQTLRRAPNGLEDVQDSTQLSAVLDGLATLAAVCRSTDLADELWSVAKRYLSRENEELTVQGAFHVAVLAAASRETLDDWVSTVGNNLTDLAFHPLNDDERGWLLDNVEWLSHFVPQLWPHCSRAVAALKSIS